MRTWFLVKYVTADAVYLDGGRTDGLAAGQKLLVKRKGSGKDAVEQEVGEIEIESVASTSAVGKILSAHMEIRVGDTAVLSREDLQKLEQVQASREASKYPQVVTFSEGNPPEQEMRDNIPRPPSPAVNRIRGRVGVEYGNLSQPGGGIGDSQYGLVLRVDATRLGGTYWNLSGYYRGLYHSQSGVPQQPTLVDLINRTYHLGFYYDNPQSRWVAGAGRLYVPWASSLSTIDGFYLGRRYGKATVGMFAGSAPDPTSWSYNPHLEMGGGFVNFQGGSYDSFRYTSTAGLALSGISWRRDRQFGFFENGFSYKDFLSVYSNQEVDLLSRSQSGLGGSLDNSQSPPAGSQGSSRVALSRSYVTVRVQPLKILSFDVSENYFRNVPTFDTRLIGTGLLDKYLFQGLSGGFRLELPLHLAIYTSLGRSSRTGDTRASWDYLAGFTAGDILHTGIRADIRYSRFDSSFGSGTYESLMLSRQLTESLTFDFQLGQQDFTSSFTNQGRSRFFDGHLDWIAGRHYFLDLGSVFYRGDVENYNQLYVTVGYRFDFKRHAIVH